MPTVAGLLVVVPGGPYKSPFVGRGVEAMVYPAAVEDVGIGAPVDAEVVGGP